MGLTRRRDSYYVEFRVIDDGEKLCLARGQDGRLKRWKVGSVNRTLAKQHEAIIKTDLMKGMVKHKPTAGFMTFADWAEAYLGLEEVKRLASFKDRDQTVRLQLVPFFGRKRLSEVTPGDVEAYRAARRRRDGSLATMGTVNNDHIMLKHMYSVAERRGLVQSNPAKRVPLPDPHNERDRVLTAEEWGQLYQAAPTHLQPILLVAYRLGPRLSEIMRLTWDRVDLSRGFIKLRSVDTKTKDPRLVPLTPDVHAALANLAKVRRLDTNRVFLYEGKPIESVKTAFHTAVRNAEIEDLRFHDLRHCAATNLRRAGVDTVTAMRIVGHKSEKMHKRYNSVSEADLTLAANKLNTYASNTIITPAALDETARVVSC
jgi:integrase